MYGGKHFKSRYLSSGIPLSNSRKMTLCLQNPNTNTAYPSFTNWNHDIICEVEKQVIRAGFQEAGRRSEGNQARANQPSRDCAMKLFTFRGDFAVLNSQQQHIKRPSPSPRSALSRWEYWRPLRLRWPSKSRSGEWESSSLLDSPLSWSWLWC